MKVSRDMLHPDLRPTYGIAAAIPRILRFPAIVRFLNFLGRVFRRAKEFEGLSREERFFTSSDGAYKVRVLIYRPEGVTGPLPAMIYFHGGGYITGSPEQAAEIMEAFVRARNCVVIAPDYRKAFTSPFPAGFNDCYETALWARDNAGQLGIHSERFILAGHSAGGGLAAAVTLKARDTREVDIAFQMPIYPMIDDRQPFDPDREMTSPVWDNRMNLLGWSSYLGALHAEDAEIPAYAVPARNSDYRGFPPTITFVGTLEPFHLETQSYVQALRDADVDVAFKEYEGCYHGFDLIGGNADVSKDARTFTYENFATFYDRYIAASGVNPQSGSATKSNL